jgi:hypothetical protein
LHKFGSHSLFLCSNIKSKAFDKTWFTTTLIGWLVLSYNCV